MNRFRATAVVDSPAGETMKIETTAESGWSAMTEVINRLASDLGLPLEAELLNRYTILVMVVVRL